MPLAWVLALLAALSFTFTDPAIDESSGLVDFGDYLVTVNDSGGDPVVFIVDPATGDTIGHTWFADAVVDPEALAPAGPDEVWVGDIGDNRANREHVTVYRVPTGPGEQQVQAPAYRLVYPDGPRDAESMVYSQGHIYVISKGLFGGHMYRAPKQLDPDGLNELELVGPVAIWATDAALFPDERHILVRGYGTAAVLTFPDLVPVGVFDLPAQPQGEGVSISAEGVIRLSSEGQFSQVLTIELPEEIAAAMQPDAATDTAGAAAATAGAEAGGDTSVQRDADGAQTAAPESSQTGSAGSTWPAWPLWVAGAAAAGSALGLGAIWGIERRSRRGTSRRSV